MIERITENEKKLDSILLSIKNLENALEDFKANQKNLQELSKYYGSKTWFKDKEKYEKKEIPNIKAGILSEDAAWNMFEDIEDLLNEMQDIINNFQKEEK